MVMVSVGGKMWLWCEEQGSCGAERTGVVEDKGRKEGTGQR